MLSIIGNWSEMTNRVRTSVITGVVVIVGLTLCAFYWLASEKYDVLFADLEPRDAASVIAELEKMKVDYSLANGGGQIKVPESSVHEIRLKLMGAGVPLVGGVGFEIFNNTDFGMTDFAQRINYQRALEGELTRTVMSLKEVKSARVHLVLPERGVFQQDDNPPSASVTLFLAAGGRPTSDQILGIQRLISASVPSLKASQVTVSDQEGVTLSRHVTGHDDVVGVAGILEQKQAVEKYLAAKVSEVLNKNFGSHQSLVSIDAVLNFNQVKRTRESVIPSNAKVEGGVVRRRETQLASDSVDGNLTTEVEYRLGRDVEQIVETPGNILRLSVGVMVPPETTAARREEIRELVKMAVGFEHARGDAIVVHGLGEPSTVTSALAKKDASAAQINTLESIQGDLVAQERGSLDLGNELKSILFRNPMKAGALMTAVGFSLLFFSYLAVRRKSTNVLLSRLSAGDRNRVLEDVRRWLNEDG